MKKLFDGKSIRMCIDQCGQIVWAHSRKELCERVGVKHVSKMYNDKKDGPPMWTGYVVGTRWFRVFQPCEVPA